MMGSGKTTLGRLLAERLGWIFTDADTVIVADAGMSIPEIFRLHGEEDFRSREEEAVRSILACPGNHVLATGGGAFCQDGVRELLLENAVTVFLKVPEEALLARLAGANPAERPMLAGDWRERVTELVRLRYPVYSRARIIVDVVDEPPGKTLERLLTAVRREIAMRSEG